MKLKPADRKFCKARCRYQHSNRNRPKPTDEFAVARTREILVTVSEAEAMGAGSRSELRGKIRRKELPVVRVFGRVLLNKSDVEKLAKVGRSL